MNAKVTLDKAGRFVFPKALRDELGLSPGDTLDLTVQGDSVTLKPRHGSSPLSKERGIWVFSDGEPLAASETQATLRAIRERGRLGDSGDR